MNTLLEAAKQALDKFNELWEYGVTSTLPEIEALRQAIEQADKQEWVGLTDEERVKAFVDAGLELAYMDYDADMKISSVIEAKLKEKNT